MLLSYYSFQLLAVVLIKSDLVLIKAGCWRCTSPFSFFCFVLEVGRWGEVWGFEAYSSELPLCRIVNCCHHILMSLLLRVGAEPHASETRHTSVSHRKEFSMPKQAYLIIQHQSQQSLFISSPSSHITIPSSSTEKPRGKIIVASHTNLSLFPPCIAPSIYSLFTLAASLSDLDQLSAPRAERTE